MSKTTKNVAIFMAIALPIAILICIVGQLYLVYTHFGWYGLAYELSIEEGQELYTIYPLYRVFFWTQIGATVGFAFLKAWAEHR